MPTSIPSREGFALVTTLLVVLVLSILAVAVVWLASSEKKTSFARGVRVTSIFAADAGTEAGINFLRVVENPPAKQNADGLVLSTDLISLQGSQNFEFDCFYVGRSYRPGWGIEYPDYDYQIKSTGYSSVKGEGHVKVLASRMFTN